MPINKTTILKGYVLGCVGSIAYGMNPLFALPLYAEGLDVSSVLFYRYLIAVLLLCIIMLRRGGFKLNWRDVPAALCVGILFALSSLLLFGSYNYMDVGIASTILFVYPVFVAILMRCGFGEHISRVTLVCMIAAMAGIVLLYDGGGSHLSAVGTLLTLGSAVSYAIYMVAVNKSRLAKLDTLQLTFYSLLFGLLVFVVQLKGLTLLKPLPPTVWAWGNLLGLSVFPTIVSLLTMTVAIHCIGSVPVSILGALEPVTALLIGAMAFDEHLTTQSFVGVSLVIAAVTALVVAKPLWSVLISVRKHRCRH